MGEDLREEEDEDEVEDGGFDEDDGFIQHSEEEDEG